MSDERLLQTFLDLVRIDSPTGEEAACAAHCIRILSELGLDVRTDSAGAAAGSDSGNVIASLPGTATGKTIVFSAHLDTVEPGRGIEPVVDGGIVTAGSDTVLGGDDKAGVAVILEALRRTVEGQAAHPPVRVLLTVAEETGLRGAKQLAAEDVQGDLCVVLDADGDPGGIVVAAPTHYTFDATFHGQSAHAGVEPEKGRSALLMAARAVSSMELGRLDDETTANIGYLSGGGRTNVVTAECAMNGECRSLDRDKVEAVRERMDSAMREAASADGGSVDIAWTLEYEGFRFDERDPMLEVVERACLAVGLTPRRFATGGGSDGNILTSKGVPTLVLSCGMHDAHSTSEYIRTADMVSMVPLLLKILEEACEPR